MLDQHILFNDKARTLLLFTLLCSITIAQSLDRNFQGNPEIIPHSWKRIILM